MGEQDKISSKIARKFATWTILAGMILFGLLTIATIINGLWFDDQWIITEAKKHFAAVIGLPSAALAALFVVAILEVTTGTIEFEGFGFKFRGASGPIILWVICFLSIAASIKLLW